MRLVCGGAGAGVTNVQVSIVVKISSNDCLSFFIVISSFGFSFCAWTNSNSNSGVYHTVHLFHVCGWRGLTQCHILGFSKC